MVVISEIIELGEAEQTKRIERKKETQIQLFKIFLPI